MKDYLLRIGIEADGLQPNIDTLCRLQRNHLLAVPFENLDIHWNRPIVLDTEKFYKKIVYEGRGGFCYELNGLFNELLISIGFQTRLVSARVYSGAEKGFGPEFDHMGIIVSIDDQEYLADVGFGDFIAEPLRLDQDVEQTDREGTFVIRRVENAAFEVAKKAEDVWIPECRFEDKPRELSEFIEMCDFQQYSPESHFKKGKVCSVMTENGRKTLSDKKFIVKTGGEKVETHVASAIEFDQLLSSEFGISAPWHQEYL